jgi:hypothetical protein
MEHPLYFSDNIKKQWTDAAYLLQPRQIENLDRIVYGVVRHAAILQKWLPTVQVPKGSRTHKLVIANELDEPIFDGDFMREDLDEARTTEQTHYLVPMHKDYALNMIDLDASSNSDHYDTKIDELNIREATLTVADYKERVLFRGMDILDRAKSGAARQGIIDARVRCLVNPPTAAGTINTFAAVGDNSGISTAGDGPLTVGYAMASEIADDYYGPYLWIMTPLVMAQFAQNFNSTTHISDIERMQAMTDYRGNKILEGLEVSKYLIKTAGGDDAGSILMMQRKTPAGEPTAVILESYPISHYPTQQSALGIKGKVLWMGCEATLRASALTLETDIAIVNN